MSEVRLRRKSVTAAAATAHATTAEAGFTGEVGVFGHGFLEWIAVLSHHRFGEVATFVGLHAGELLGATG